MTIDGHNEEWKCAFSDKSGLVLCLCNVSQGQGKCSFCYIMTTNKLRNFIITRDSFPAIIASLWKFERYHSVRIIRIIKKTTVWRTFIIRFSGTDHKREYVPAMGRWFKCGGSGDSKMCNISRMHFLKTYFDEYANRPKVLFPQYMISMRIIQMCCVHSIAYRNKSQNDEGWVYCVKKREITR